MENNLYIEVVFNTPLKNTFSYLPPEDISEEELSLLKCGIRVKASLGKRKLTGFITGTSYVRPEGDFKIKRIEKVIDSDPLFDNSYYETAKWIAGMYICSVGEVLFRMVPVGKRKASIIYRA